MKKEKFKHRTILILFVIFVFSSIASAQKIESVYTDLKSGECRKIDKNENQGWTMKQCPGAGDFRLNIIEGDLRQSLKVAHAKSGNEWDLYLEDILSNGNSTLGEKAEWRVKKSGNAATPIALIFRYDVAENPDNTEKYTSYLVVTKISGELLCVTDVVKPGTNANTKARELADASANKPCKTAGF